MPKQPVCLWFALLTVAPVYSLILSPKSPRRYQWESSLCSYSTYKGENWKLKQDAQAMSAEPSPLISHPVSPLDHCSVFYFSFPLNKQRISVLTGDLYRFVYLTAQDVRFPCGFFHYSNRSILHRCSSSPAKPSFLEVQVMNVHPLNKLLEWRPGKCFNHFYVQQSLSPVVLPLLRIFSAKAFFTSYFSRNLLKLLLEIACMPWDTSNKKSHGLRLWAHLLLKIQSQNHS